ncbi:MAG: universal stress protein [Acidobacteria bacterium]|nr:universal stress protein [Acidobacteriota bacterium]
MNTMQARDVGSGALPPANILVPTDFGVAANLALDHGRSLARAYGATLHIVHVMKDASTAAVIDAPAAEYDRADADLERHNRERLEALAVSSEPGVPVKTEILRSASPALAILGYARRAAADLIVMGTHGRSAISDFILGSVAQKVIRSAACPVMTVRASSPVDQPTERGTHVF